MPRGAKIQHGHKRVGAASPEYKTWMGIKRRCNNPKCKDYAKYGARGIKLSAEWEASFTTFLADMGPRPSPTHQIDRIDPTKGYEAGNCRWVTPSIQGAENRRSIIPVEVGGLSFTSIAAACRHFGLNKTAVNYRLKAGKSIEQAFQTSRLKPDRTRESYLPMGHPDRA